MKELAEYISINPDVRFGKPCIKGTRIAISDILQWMAFGATQEEILHDYPSLVKEHILAALLFAANREAMIKNNSRLNMKLLLDANVSWRLAAQLQAHFDVCLHVDFIELTVPAKDIDIWNYALANQLIIVTNDEDFLNLMSIKGFPPKIVLLKTGNQSNQYIELLLIKHKPEIAALHHSKEYGVLELF